MKLYLFLILLFLIPFQSFGQQCSTRGQTPETAFPVCAEEVFHQNSVPACVNKAIPVKGCQGDGVTYEDESPFWYRFTCFKSGKLGFLISPDDKRDDYDWQLFDITDHDPKDVYTHPSLFVSGNWSGESGNTGASAKGKSNLVCATLENSPKRPLFSSMPQLEKGHHYLLLISHFSGAPQSGYDLSFGGGTAVITDTTTPRLKKAIPDCDGKSITVSLNKALKCSSLSSDGSDFKIVGTSVGIKAAASKGCKTGFEMKEIKLKLNGRLAPGQYTLKVQKGKDGNTLLDICGTPVSEKEKIHFEVKKAFPIPMDSVTKLHCEPKHIDVVFKGWIKNNSIAKDGSDFKILNKNTGTPLNITKVESLDKSADNGNAFRIFLNTPIYKAADYRLILQKGSDGNTAMSHCDIASIAGQELTFQSYDTVNAAIVPSFDYACNKVKVVLKNPLKNGINSLIWFTDTGFISNQTAISYTDSNFVPKTFQLKVSNGVCMDTRQKTIRPNKVFFVDANFSMPKFVCPQDLVNFKNKSKGKAITGRKWTFGNGEISFLSTPSRQHYPETRFSKKYQVRLIVTNSMGCKDTAIKEINVINTCKVHVPTAFTPNGDGQNDKLYPLNAYLTKNLIFRIYNRYGQMVFQTKDWREGWDGQYKGKPAATGSYVWTLNFTNSETGEKVFRKGATVLIR